MRTPHEVIAQARVRAGSRIGEANADAAMLALTEAGYVVSRAAELPLDAQVARLQALFAAASEFLSTPSLARLVVQGVWMTREQVVAEIRAMTRKP
ncbi:hypothetical protein [Paracraurococcus lichenis]|uniref:Uncharacterized protein n=1 Tax=Paracraurococcus lichenis TaxID=3064888 RepID=A0ABT9E8H2_9PROT|nr:hypothetical protein [Paracraurococcus sp. LOR1-02]MDO9712479.1 hypothetical protein [Paracraurococcus sp. LOR1-02]